VEPLGSGYRQFLQDIGLQGAAILAQAAPQRNAPSPLHPGPLGPQCGPGPAADKGPFVFGEGLEQPAHQHLLGAGSIPGPVRALDLGSQPLDEALDEALDGGGQIDIPAQPVPFGHDQEASSLGLHLLQGLHEAWALIHRRSPADPLVQAPGANLDAFPACPGLDLGPLRLGPKALLLGADSEVGHGHERVGGRFPFPKAVTHRSARDRS